MKSKSHLAPVLTALVVMLGGGYLVGISVSQSLMTSVAPALVTGVTPDSDETEVTVSWSVPGDNAKLTNQPGLTLDSTVGSDRLGSLTAFVENPEFVVSSKEEHIRALSTDSPVFTFSSMKLREGANVVYVAWKEVDEEATKAAVKRVILAAVEKAVRMSVDADSYQNPEAVGDAVKTNVTAELREIVTFPTNLRGNLANASEEPAETSARQANEDANVAEVTEAVIKAVVSKLREVIDEAVSPLRTKGNSTLEYNKRAQFSEKHTIILDTIGPKLKSASLVDMPGAGPTLVVRFVDADANQLALGATKHYAILRETQPGKFTESVSAILEPSGDGRTARFYLGKLTTGAYRFIALAEMPDPVPDELTGVEAFTDKAGNPAGRLLEGGDGRDIVYTFSSMPERERGEHVEFPPFAPPTPRPAPDGGFNPADYVDTRVARLYYYRDAHRVAEILNRNVKSYNRAAVTQAEQRAQGARVTAEEKTDARRKAEREAVRAADKTRNAENKLNDARQVLREATNVQNEKEDAEFESTNIALRHGLGSNPNQPAKLTALETAQADTKAKREALENADDPTPEERAALTDALNKAQLKEANLTQMLKLDETARRADANLKRLGGDRGVQQIQEYVGQVESAVAQLRQAEITAQEKSDTAQASEDRAIEEQFRQEVAAAHEDPDTYVPGDYMSVDPVTQVSISVIGEGLIHLRGPMRGINKIRNMINQIDTPVGQIKIGIETIQVNGEDGDAMEEVIGRIQGEIDLGRFLTIQSLNLLRKSIQIEAGLVAEAAQTGGNYQVDRDRKYLYTFYGRDFIDELYAIDSEFLRTENAILSLHSMDTISLNRALFTLSLAKNNIRENIMCRFLELVKTELPDAEFDFRRSSELRPHHTQKHFPPWNLAHLPLWNKPRIETVIREAVDRNARQRYHFRNIRGFFDVGFGTADVMNPMQREFVRLAQIYKARMIAEMELKQRVMERALIEDPANDNEERAAMLKDVHEKALEQLRAAWMARVRSQGDLDDEWAKIAPSVLTLSVDLQDFDRNKASFRMLMTKLEDLRLPMETMAPKMNFSSGPSMSSMMGAQQYAPQARQWSARTGSSLNRHEQKQAEEFYDNLVQLMTSLESLADDVLTSNLFSSELKEEIERERDRFHEWKFLSTGEQRIKEYYVLIDELIEVVGRLEPKVVNQLDAWQEIAGPLTNFYRNASNPESKFEDVESTYFELARAMGAPKAGEPETLGELRGAAATAYREIRETHITRARAEAIARETRGDLNHRKLLNLLIDEHEDKLMELIEGTRSHICVMDNYLKRLAVAIEDDMKTQFYEPAFVRIRLAARDSQVNLGQVERTSILTNNRTFAKVLPGATMEFDLPKRQIAVVEAFEGAKAMMQDYGALMNDPTFLAAFQMMGGTQMPAKVENVLPGLSSETDAQTMGLVPRDSGQSESALQALVPEPSIFKLETGTGFQIRPVILPDGDSVIYDFDYMYTTNIREPVRADEKHLGRVKRHFIHTQVQTSSFELREISRYQVALKVSRTSRGVPLLEDIPILGPAFRPAPSAESSIQQNIILGRTTVYPTMFDLMGLRWAPHVVDVDHASLLDAEHVVRGRRRAISDYVFDTASARVDEILKLKTDHNEHYRPDLYHRRRQPSPYHPGGYTYGGQSDPNQQPGPETRSIHDPSGRNFERIDRRPPEMQQPPYELYRHTPVAPEPVELGPAPQPIGSTPFPNPVSLAPEPRMAAPMPSTRVR